MTPTFALFSLSPMEIIIILGLGVLLFGRKLPDMGRYVGQAWVQLRKGMTGDEDEIIGTTNASSRYTPAPPPPQRINATTPTFNNSSITITTPTTM